MSQAPEPPPVEQLSRAQYDGWACCWCGKSLLHGSGVVSAGIARGNSGVHVLDVEVFACGPACPRRPHGPQSGKTSRT
ncbi:hypothetical protein [Streptomyces sp. NPDC096142]|uniref:hypothetical protein n=1 Tax=Streptomyces sp. NPDC096142 TaxID=3366077 RepID=UPI003828469F